MTKFNNIKLNILLACSSSRAALATRGLTSSFLSSPLQTSSTAFQIAVLSSGIGVRNIHLPSDPTIRYKSIQAMVIKDRSPTGKFKFKPSAKGIVTVFITVTGILND
jgi:hypothetical protein